MYPNYFSYNTKECTELREDYIYTSLEIKKKTFIPKFKLTKLQAGKTKKTHKWKESKSFKENIKINEYNGDLN